jgi:hypothetical protein
MDLTNVPRHKLELIAERAGYFIKVSDRLALDKSGQDLDLRIRDVHLAKMNLAFALEDMEDE